MVIRPARQADLRDIAALHTESWRDAYGDVLPKRYLHDQLATDLQRHWSSVEIRPNDVVLVAEDRGMIGFIAVWCRLDPFIDNLHVKPSKRSNRIGSNLIRLAARQLLLLGHQTAYLWVVSSNQRAIRFYESLGGVCTERVLKNLFGFEVPNTKVEWSDIAVICTGT